jgi:hypothetical protein
MTGSFMVLHWGLGVATVSRFLSVRGDAEAAGKVTEVATLILLGQFLLAEQCEGIVV